MQTYEITTQQAESQNQTKLYGIYSEGCIGPWGEGDDLTSALEDARRNYPDLEFGDVWAERIVRAAPTTNDRTTKNQRDTIDEMADLGYRLVRLGDGWNHRWGIERPDGQIGKTWATMRGVRRWIVREFVGGAGGG